MFVQYGMRTELVRISYKRTSDSVYKYYSQKEQRQYIDGTLNPASSGDADRI